MTPDELLAAVQRANAARRAGRPAAGRDAEAVLEARFGCQWQLAVYGTLAPGAENHAVLAPCDGTWRSGQVRGVRGMGAYPLFRFDPNAPPQPVQLLRSERLPQFWPAIDEFEGDQYHRVLVPVELDGGECTVANLYEAAVPFVG